MKRVFLILVSLLALVGPAAHCSLAETAVVELQPLPVQDLRQGLRQTRLNIKNTTPQLVGALSVQPADGGPTIVAEAVIPPGQTKELVVSLPAWSVQQTYAVRLFRSVDDAQKGAAPLDRLEAGVSWPPEYVNADRFINEQFEQALPPAVAWPASLKRDVILAAVLACLAMAGAWLIRRPAWRLLVLGIAVAGATVAVAAVVGHAPLVAYRESTIGEGTSARPVLAMATRRTVTVALPPGTLPLYVSKEWAQDDNAILLNEGGGQVRLQPGQVRLFETAGGLGYRTAGYLEGLPLPPASGPASSGPSSSSSSPSSAGG